MVWPTLGSRTAKEQEQDFWRLSVMLQEGHMALGKAVLFWTDKFAYLYKEKRHL